MKWMQWMWGLALPLILLTGCEQPANEGGPRTGPLKITTTIGMIADVAGHIGGPHVSVTPLMGPGVDPHLYKATHGDLEKLGGADLILYNGLHLEGKMGEVLENMGKRVQTVQVTRSIPENLLRKPPEFEGNFDPHVWFDVSLWRHVAEEIRAVLSEVDPDHAAAFQTNATAYIAALDELHTYAKDQLAMIPESQRILVTAHDAFGYFGRAYGLDVMGIQGISTASEYGLQDLDRLANVLVERKVKAVFVETSLSPKSIEALIAGVENKGHAVALGGNLYSDAMGEQGTPEGSYIGMVRHNVDTIVNALK